MEYGQMPSKEIGTWHQAATNKPFTKYDADWQVFVAHMQQTLQARLSSTRMQLFVTEPKMKATPGIDQLIGKIDVDLNMVYLAAIREDERQYHTCRCCRRFLERFGALVVIDAEGKSHPALWDSTTFPRDNFYFTVVERLEEVVRSARVKGVFKTSEAVLGDPTLGGYGHMSVMLPQSMIWIAQPRKDAYQRAAELLEDYKRMAEDLDKAEYLSVKNLGLLKQVIENDVLAGDEKINGVSSWLIQTAAERRATLNVRIKENLLWRAVASALPGYTHPGTTMVGTVLNDLLAGKSVKKIQEGYIEKTRPDIYRRMQAEATQQQIELAEKIVAELGLEPSLKRRAAKMEDILPQAYDWQPAFTPVAPTPEAKPTVFAHLKEKAVDGSVEPDGGLKFTPVSMSWNKFSEDLLAGALEIEIYIDSTPKFFSSLMTATHADAPPVLAYDTLEARNPVSAYQRYEMVKTWQGEQMIGMPPAAYNLTPHQYHKVKAIIRNPHLWTGDTSMIGSLGTGKLFVIDGAKDLTLEKHRVGLALFPAILKKELKEVERVFEHHQNSAEIDGDVEGQVIGVTIAKGIQFAPRRLRITSATGRREVIIDRWE